MINKGEQDNGGVIKMNEYLNEQFNECLKIVEDLGITHGNIVSVKAKPTKRLANCVKDGTKYTLTFHSLNQQLFQNENYQHLK